MSTQLGVRKAPRGAKVSSSGCQDGREGRRRAANGVLAGEAACHQVVHGETDQSFGAGGESIAWPRYVTTGLPSGSSTMSTSAGS